jgi:hypothetical protein
LSVESLVGDDLDGDMQRPSRGVASGQSSVRTSARLLQLVLLIAVVALVAFPGVAEAHGPIAPVASSYFAKPLEVPAGLEAKVVDGDLRMWLSVPADETVVVLDYRGAPYLRFSPGGVAVNYNSSMYYLNQTPFAQTPPGNLTASTPPSWHVVSSGHSYEWHDGRLHALATVALTPGVAFVGRWTVPLRIDGGSAAIGGGLWHADDRVPRTRKEELSRSRFRRMRCCTRDEGARPVGLVALRGRPAGGGRKPPRGAPVKSRGAERRGDGALSARQVWITKASGSEPPLKCRKRIGDIRNRGRVVAPGGAWREPADWLGGCPAWMVARA